VGEINIASPNEDCCRQTGKPGMQEYILRGV
jgi:hypothetical protein